MVYGMAVWIVAQSCFVTLQMRLVKRSEIGEQLQKMT
jgi:hypothetical protein